MLTFFADRVQLPFILLLVGFSKEKKMADDITVMATVKLAASTAATTKIGGTCNEEEKIMT